MDIYDFLQDFIYFSDNSKILWPKVLNEIVSLETQKFLREIRLVVKKPADGAKEIYSTVGVPIFIFKIAGKNFTKRFVISV